MIFGKLTFHLGNFGATVMFDSSKMNHQANSCFLEHLILATGEPLLSIHPSVLKNKMRDPFTFQCHRMLEENEELLEHFWFKVYKADPNVDFFKWVCVDEKKGMFYEKKLLCMVKLLQMLYRTFSVKSIESKLIM